MWWQTSVHVDLSWLCLPHPFPGKFQDALSGYTRQDDAVQGGSDKFLIWKKKWINIKLCRVLLFCSDTVLPVGVRFVYVSQNAFLCICVFLFLSTAGPNVISRDFWSHECDLTSVLIDPVQEDVHGSCLGDLVVLSIQPQHLLTPIIHRFTLGRQSTSVVPAESHTAAHTATAKWGRCLNLDFSTCYMFLMRCVY